jgi:hypothetical protein
VSRLFATPVSSVRSCGLVDQLGSRADSSSPSADIKTALEASKDAIEQMILAGERTNTAWTSPRAPGKWSPSQIAEHVARSLEESANMAAGRP